MYSAESKYQILSLSPLVTVVLALAAFSPTEAEGYTVNSINTQLEFSGLLSHGVPSSSDMYVYTNGKLGRIDGDPASDQYNTIYSKAILPPAVRTGQSDLLFNPRSNHVYYTSGDCFRDRTYISLANIHSGTIVQNIEFTKGFGGQILMPGKLVYNNNNGDMYVRAEKAIARDYGCVPFDHSILVIDSNTNSVKREIKLNCSDQINCFRLMTFVHKEGVGYIYGLAKSGIQVLDTRSGNIVKTIEVGDPTQDPADIRYNPYDGKIYVVKQGPWQVIPKPDPDDICLGECADVPCREGVVSVVDPISDTVLDDNAEIHCPTFLGFSENDEIFVTQYDRGAGSEFEKCTDPGFVTVLNPSLDVVDQVHVGRCPNHIGYNSANGNMYVSNEGSYCKVSIDPNCSRLCENTPGATNFLPSREQYTQCQLPYTISVISTLKPSVSNVTSSVFDLATYEDITNKRGIPFGTSVTDRASVQMGWEPPVPYPPVQSPIPTGKIRYTFFLNAKCTNETGLWPDGAMEYHPIESNGYIRYSHAPNLKFSPAASFQATYIDDKNSTYTGNCEPIPEVLPPSINSKILKNYTYPPIEVTSVPEGTVVFDSATFSNTNRVPPEGTVTYQRFDNSYCGGEPVHRDVVNVTWTRFGQYIPYSSNFTAHGDASYLAIYHGMNILDHWTDSGCEKLAISSVGLEIIDQSNNTIVTNGTVGPNGTVRAFGTISEDLSLAGGTVDYRLFRGNDCDEATHDPSWDKKVEVGTGRGLPPSDAFSFTSPETISYKATYNGPAGTIDSHCKFVTSISQ